MLIHRGKIVEDVVRKSSISITEISKRMDYTRSTPYQHFKNEDLEYSIIIMYGKALRHDFSIEFPEIVGYMNMLEEPLSGYRTYTVAEALQERDIWKDKYINLLEKHNEMLSQYEKKQ